MTQYNPQIDDIRFCLKYLAGMDDILQLPAFDEIDDDMVDQILEEAARFARDVIAPTNSTGDAEGCEVVDKTVRAPESFADAYRQFVDNGWQAVDGTTEYGGMGMPSVAGFAVAELWQTANLALSLASTLTSDGIAAIQAHASDELKRLFLPKLISGEWSATMNLTEPQSGSDLSTIKTRAERRAGRYHLRGTKIFVTWGDHEFASNIIHLVLARLNDAPDGVNGISLFLVPKYLLDKNGEPGERNDVTPQSVEHKLGIHGSPTCVLSFGDTDGAIGYLLGEENRGLAAMFTMMNHARISVGMQGLAVSERAYQLARDYANERIQGQRPDGCSGVPIIEHPDVRRMLMTMKTMIEAMRATTYATAVCVDNGRHGEDADKRSAAQRHLSLMTPIIKGWLTELAQEVTSLGVQVHGGMGYVEETGAAQFMRDARILPIYEGTNGIQAADFTGRKVRADSGREIRKFIAEIRELENTVKRSKGFEEFGDTIFASIDLLSDAVDWLVEHDDDDAIAAASFDLLMLAGTVLGGWYLTKSAWLASRSNEMSAKMAQKKIVSAHFYCSNILPRAKWYFEAATRGSKTTMLLQADAF